jgi:hypothetical protein
MSRSVILGVGGVSQVKDDGRVRPGTTTVGGEDGFKVNRTVEAESTVGENVNPVALVITGCVDNGYLLMKVSLNRPRVRIMMP